jgi:hypothetical protein
MGNMYEFQYDLKLVLTRISMLIAYRIDTHVLRYMLQVSPTATFFFVGWDLRHQVLRPLLAYCTAPDDR